MAENDAGFAEVVRGHLDVYPVSHTDANEVFSHLSRNVGQDFMAIGQRDSKHGAGQDLSDRSGDFYGFFFSQVISPLADGLRFIYAPRLRQDSTPSAGRTTDLWAGTMPFSRHKIKQTFAKRMVKTPGSSPKEIYLFVLPSG